MAIHVVIKQKGFIKRALPLDVIIGDELKYGAFGLVRLSFDKIDENGFVAYSPNCIGRGFNVQWRQGEKKNVILHLLLPSTSEELKYFLNCINRIAGYWNCSIEVDGVQTGLSKLLNSLPDLESANLKIMKEMIKEVIDDKSNPTTIFCACWTIVIGKKRSHSLY